MSRCWARQATSQGKLRGEAGALIRPMALPACKGKRGRGADASTNGFETQVGRRHQVAGGVDRRPAADGFRGLASRGDGQFGPVALLTEMQQHHLSQRPGLRTLDHGRHKIGPLFVRQMALLPHVPHDERAGGRPEPHCIWTS